MNNNEKINWNTCSTFILTILFTAFILLSAPNLLNLTALILVPLGTFLSLLFSSPWDKITQLGHHIKKLFITEKASIYVVVRNLLNIALSCKQEEPTHNLGILKKQPILRKGLLMLTENFEAETIQTVLEEMKNTEQKSYAQSESLLKKAAHIAPSIGLIGTLFGLIQMFSQLASPEDVAQNLAVALVTTLYGAIISALFLMPLATRCQIRAENKDMLNTLYITTILAIAHNTPEEQLEAKLNAFIHTPNQEDQR